jgi:hypothetical protein
MRAIAQSRPQGNDRANLSAKDMVGLFYKHFSGNARRIANKAKRQLHQSQRFKMKGAFSCEEKRGSVCT